MRYTVFILLAIISIALRANGQTTPYHYTIQANLQAQLIYCISQDNYGRLLIGTDKGLYRYNGFRSRRITSADNSSKEITQLVKFGSDFFASNRSGQLLQLSGDKLKLVTLEGFTGDIRSISVEGKELQIVGSKWMTRYTLPEFRLLEQKEIPYTEPEGTQANDVLEFNNAHYAVLNSGELVQLEEQSSRNIPGSTGKMLVKYEKQLVIIPAYVTDNPLYTYLDGMFRNRGSLARYGKFRVTNAHVIGSQLFVLSENGVYVYSNGLSRRPAHWFAGVNTTDLFKDARGNLWIATKGKGLLFIPAGHHEIIYPSTLLSIETGPNGTFFGGTLNGTVIQFDKRGRLLETFASASNNQEALFLYFDKAKSLLFSNTGLFAVNTGEQFNKINDAIKGAVRLADGSVYLAKSGGVYYFSQTKDYTKIYGLTDTTKVQQLRREAAKCLVLNEKTQEVAFCTVKGVFLRKGQESLQEITFEGRPIDAQTIAWYGNDLVIATNDHELLLVRNGKVIKRKDLSAHAGEIVVLKMLSGGKHVYLLTERGMYRFSDFDRKLEALQELSGFDGLVMRDFTIIGDEMYLVTQRGVLRFVWKAMETSGIRLVLGKVTGRKYPEYKHKNGVIYFPFDESLIQIPLECVDLSGNQQFIIRYAIHTPREKGYWNALPAGTEHLNLSHLGPGEYTVEFYLYDPVSQTKSPLQRRQFVVQHNWYKRPWLIWTGIIALLLAVGITWRWTILRERKKSLPTA